MMNSRRGLMISTMLMSAMGVGGVVGNVWAADVQCLKTPSCEELGYTEVACFQNNGVKCPYGDKYFCVCPMNYKFTCTGENQTGGVGEDCNGKYTACNCSGGLMWGDGACVENCPLGSILFDDFTCSDDVVSGKTPIGIVVYKDGKGAGQALALKSLGDYKWSTEYVDISGLTNYTSAEAASKDYASCQNSILIKSQGSSSAYPAVWAAHNYTTAGTKVGDWCLPAAGIFTSIYNNQSTINTGFSRANGTQFTTSTYAWSSSEYDTDTGSLAWYSYFDRSYGLYYNYGKDVSREVRPVIGFCDDAENYVYNQATDSCVKDGCQLGAIFYSDKTCSMKLKDGKTPIGVVVYVDENGTNAQVMAQNSLDTKYTWGGYGTDISGLPNLSNAQASQDFASCENSAKIRAHGDSSIHPAVWAAYNYSTEGTKVGDWCLPAAGIFTSYYNNQSVINTGFIRAGGTKFTTSTYAWSSSEVASDRAWRLTFSNVNGVTNPSKDTSGNVRPVLEGSIASEGAEFCSNSYQYTCGGANETGGGDDSCGGKFNSCTCADGYGWSDGACAVCDTSYQYTCNGANETGGDGESCSGKYTSCSCAEGYRWENGRCVVSCDSSYQFSCTGSHQSPSGIACGGKYKQCNCDDGYTWAGCYNSSGKMQYCIPGSGSTIIECAII